MYLKPSEILPETEVYIIIDLEENCRVITRQSIQEKIDDGSIQVGYTVLQVLVHNSFVATNVIQLTNEAYMKKQI